MKKKILALLLTGILGVSMLAGCGAEEEAAPAAEAAEATEEAAEEAPAEEAAEEAAEESGEAVEEEAAEEAPAEDAAEEEEEDAEDAEHLVMTALLFAPITNENMDRVEKKLNEITLDKINCTLDVQWMDPGAYMTNVPMMLQANEQLDLLMFTPIPVCGFQSFMNQKQLMDITDLLPEYAPDVVEVLGDYLKATSKEGRVYGVGNLQCFEQHLSIDMRRDVLEDLGLLEDAQNLTNFQDFEKILQKVKEETDLNPIVNSDSEGTVITTQPFLAGDGDFADAGWVDNCGDSYYYTYADPADNKIKCYFENEKWLKGIKMVRDWYNKGLVYKDAQTSVDSGLTLIRNQVAFCDSSATELGCETQAENTTGFPDLNVQISDAKVSTNTFQKFGFAVPVTSKNPEKALELLNLMWADEGFRNTITWGIEGEDWIVNEDGMACFPEGKSPENTYHTADFFYGNRLEIIPWEGQPVDIRQQMKDSNEKTEVSEFFGFSVDSENVATQVTAVKAVVDEYKPGLSSGALTDDVDGKVAEMVQKMYDAGLQDVIDEYQRQLDAWLAEQK